MEFSHPVLGEDGWIEMPDKLSVPFPRRKTHQIKIGRVPVGRGAPIVVQSMTKTDTRNVQATIAQIKRMEEAGCEIVRAAVLDVEAVEALSKIKREVQIPLIADIHFDHKLALAAIAIGVDGLRINPGNIGAQKRVEEVVRAAKASRTPIRIGVNSGSLEKKLLQKYGEATAEAMVESALHHIRILEDLDFTLIKVSLKASDIFRTVKASQLLAEKVDYPFHAGITEAGSLVAGSVKSAAGLTILLSHGLADTIRVSLTAPPEAEIRVAYQILSSLGIRKRGADVISCPICGRCEVNLPTIADEVEKRLLSIRVPLTVAVMGCMVNGPGEAKEADIGIACGKGVGILFKQGQLVRRIKEADIIDEFVAEVQDLAQSLEKSSTPPQSR
jgi:(E)-4-hydroxy-3-methylbut-2-enyl-diphosphate synthase